MVDRGAGKLQFVAVYLEDGKWVRDHGQGKLLPTRMGVKIQQKIVSGEVKYQVWYPPRDDTGDCFCVNVPDLTRLDKISRDLTRYYTRFGQI